LHNHNEQFFQVGLLDQALISLSLALSPSSTSVIFGLYGAMQVFLKINYTYFTLPCRGLGLVGLAILPGGLTNCCPSVLDTVGWVI